MRAGRVGAGEREPHLVSPREAHLGIEALSGLGGVQHHGGAADRPEVIDGALRQQPGDSAPALLRVHIDAPDVAELAVRRHDHVGIGLPVELAGGRPDVTAVLGRQEHAELQVGAAVAQEIQHAGFGVRTVMRLRRAVAIPERKVMSRDGAIVGLGRLPDFHRLLLSDLSWP